MLLVVYVYISCNIWHITLEYNTLCVLSFSCTELQTSKQGPRTAILGTSKRHVNCQLSGNRGSMLSAEFSMSATIDSLLAVAASEKLTTFSCRFNPQLHVNMQVGYQEVNMQVGYQEEWHKPAALPAVSKSREQTAVSWAVKDNSRTRWN